MRKGKHQDIGLLEHILMCIEHIRGYVVDGKDVFLQSTMIQDAVIRKLQILAESSQRLSDECKLMEPSIPWQKISGMRNILVHDYLDGIDPNTVWDVVESDLTHLQAALQRLQQQVQKGDAT